MVAAGTRRLVKQHAWNPVEIGHGILEGTKAPTSSGDRHRCASSLSIELRRRLPSFSFLVRGGLLFGEDLGCKSAAVGDSATRVDLVSRQLAPFGKLDRVQIRADHSAATPSNLPFNILSLVEPLIVRTRKRFRIDEDAQQGFVVPSMIPTDSGRRSWHFWPSARCGPGLWALDLCTQSTELDTLQVTEVCLTI